MLVKGATGLHLKMQPGDRNVYNEADVSFIMQSSGLKDGKFRTKKCMDFTFETLIKLSIAKTEILYVHY